METGPAPFSSGSSPWVDLAIGILGSPKVHFTGSGQRMARWAGLQAVIEAWRAAQAYRAQNDRGPLTAVCSSSTSTTSNSLPQEGREAADVILACNELARVLTVASDMPMEAVVRVVDAGRANSVVGGVMSVDYAFVRGRCENTSAGASSLSLPTPPPPPPLTPCARQV